MFALVVLWLFTTPSFYQGAVLLKGRAALILSKLEFLMKSYCYLFGDHVTVTLTGSNLWKAKLGVQIEPACRFRCSEPQIVVGLLCGEIWMDEASARTASSLEEHVLRMVQPLEMVFLPQDGYAIEKIAGSIDGVAPVGSSLAECLVISEPLST
jgi:hypothetical protein